MPSGGISSASIALCAFCTLTTALFSFFFLWLTHGILDTPLYFRLWAICICFCCIFRKKTNSREKSMGNIRRREYYLVSFFILRAVWAIPLGRLDPCIIRSSN
ncbi:hypothetical protein V8C35DRAFT_123960 [Trichoderma chlorosporum]